MLFNSAEFLIFFPLVTLGYFLIPPRFRCGWLVAASCYFYMAFIPPYIFILLALIAIDYTAGRLIEKAQGRSRRLLLATSLVANLAFLGTFKYYDFFNQSLAAAAHHFGWRYTAGGLGLALPIGLSFHTFQSMAYTIEVYRGRCRAERDPLRYALYVLFYPQMVAGPIERPQNLLPQLSLQKEFDYGKVSSGLRLMLWGFIEKVVIADRLALAVIPVYSNPRAFSGPALLGATYLFSFQIYCDFCGYSDIAIGAARVMGIDLMQNFRRPYLAASVGEFWHRWHISLSTWFRDYLYIPLGGSRRTAVRVCFNLALVFLLSGLWHGANWTFVIWGALHGAYMVASRLSSGLRQRVVSWLGLERSVVRQWLRIFFTFNLVSFAWIFFRANSLADALYIVQHLLQGWAVPLRWGSADAGLMAAELAGLMLVLLLQERGISPAAVLQRQPRAVRWAAYYAALAILLFFGVFNSAAFIYFQF